MKNLKYSKAARIIAGILFIFFFTSAIGCLFSIVYISREGFYQSPEFYFYESPACSRITRTNTQLVYHDYLLLYTRSKKDMLSSSELRQLKQYEKRFSPENTNFMFSVSDTRGRVVLSNYKASDPDAKLIWSKDPVGWIDDSHGKIYDEEELVKSYVREISAKDDYYLPFMVLRTLYTLRYVLIAAAAFSAIIALLLFLFLIRSAGHRKDSDGIVLGFFDKIPFDIYALCILFIWFCCVSISVHVYGASIIWTIAEYFIAFVATVLFFLLLLMSFAVRVKAGKWWRNTVIYIFSNWLVKITSTLINNIPLLGKSVGLFLVYLLFNGILVLSLLGGGGGPVVFMGFLLNTAVLIAICSITLQMNSLKLYAEKIALGDYEPKIDTSRLLWDLKSHAETLNNIGNGMSRAVDERIKSERLKAELITNVSHDIKTPLTSIINYVDLLKKENIEDDKAREYLDILDRQSAKLKKLTVDLVDASKASTGNVALSLERIEITEFLNQSVGEYSERFAACGLEALVSSPTEKAFIYADGRLLWRVFDNLLCNVCKYAMPNTRVYLDVEKGAKRTTVTLKNISGCPLNITPDELMERFVRGDRSRSTDGSGLGLSIAKSLTELMKGSFDLSVDGDLFKVTLKFDSLRDESANF